MGAKDAAAAFDPNQVMINSQAHGRMQGGGGGGGDFKLPEIGVNSDVIQALNVVATKGLFPLALKLPEGTGFLATLNDGATVLPGPKEAASPISNVVTSPVGGRKGG